MAAEELVKGTVLDERGEPLVGVNVMLKGTTTGTITDMDGKFTLMAASANDILVISYLGYQTQEVRVNLKRAMSIGLIEDRKALDEVVVVGYQDLRKRDLTGSVGKANVEDLLKAPVPSFDQALAGRVAGVNVSSAEGMPGGSMNIVIRGNNSVTQDNSPLYVIDGFPVEDASVASTINPNDIESIDILKDASATAIYGSRGANGVVIISTKKGMIGAPQVTYDGSFGIQHITRKLPLLSAYEFVKLQTEMYTQNELESYHSYFPTKGDLLTNYDGRIPNEYFAALLADKPDDYRVGLSDYEGISTYDWQDMIFRDAWQQNHSLGLTGGTAEARYNASFSYVSQDGIVKYSNYNRFQGRVGLNVKKNRLTINLKANYSMATTNGSSPSQSQYSGMNNLFYSVWGYRPVTQPGTPLQNLIDADTDDNVNANNDYRFNPIKSLKNEYRVGKTQNVQFNGFLEYEFIKGLKLRVSGGYTIYDRKTEAFNNSNTRYGMATSTNKVNATFGSYDRRTWLNENYLTYQTSIKKAHNINVMAGVSLQGSNYKTYTMLTTQIPYESLGMSGMDDGTPNTITATESDWTMFSYYARASYDYKNRYYVTATFRSDGSSKMAKGHKFGYFPSASAAWSIIEEPWVAPAKPWLSNAKVRASWGMTGNNRVGEYDAYAQLEQRKTSGTIYSGVYATNNTIVTGVVPMSLPNVNLRWETTTQTDVGVDLGFCSDRIGVTVDWYQKITEDLLLAADMAPSSGYPSATKNVGSVQNMGWEITVNAVPVEIKNFRWDMSFNIAFNDNKVLALAENQVAMLTNARFDQGYTSPNYIAKVGYPIGMMYGYIYDGTYKAEEFDGGEGSYTLKAGIPYFSAETNTQPGYPKYRDLNGDGIIDSNDQTFIGNGTPKHTGGFTNNFSFYGVDMSIFFQWSAGNDILNANKLFFENGNKNKELNMFAGYANRYTRDNPTSDIPCVANTSSNKVFSSRLIEDGSYLRLKTVSIGYTIPSQLTKKARINKFRIYVSGQNLWTLTRYSGYDPEVSVKNSALTPGLDFSAYPRAMSFNMGVNVGF